MDLGEFHLMLGETIMCCQRIEHDIKLILAGMQKGNFDYNYEEILNAKMPLGDSISELQKLDNSDKHPHLSKEDYSLLFKVNGKRNHWAHETYQNFIYIDNTNGNNDAFNKEAKRLEKDHKLLFDLCGVIEKTRLDILRKYGLID